MQFFLTEPTNPRYLWVNPETNHIHILMPMVGGVEIGTDNTCKSVASLQEFFGKTADVHQRALRDELNAYQKALTFDISLLSDDDTLKAQKIARLQQIEYYLKALDALLKTDTLESLNFHFPEYPALLKERMQRKDSNLHSMVLCPNIKDNYLRFVSPVFSVSRDGRGALYRTLSSAYQGTKPLNAKTRFIQSVLSAAAARRNNLVVLQEKLTILAKNKLNTPIDFTLTQDKEGRDLHLMSKLPNSFEQHHKSYLFVKKDETRELYYITSTGACEKVTIENFDLFEEKIKDINKLNKSQLYLRHEQIEKMITSNGGYTHKEPVTKAYIDGAIGRDENQPEEYIEMLLALCAPNDLFENLTESPFYTWENAEDLSIITQFFFGITNIYCKTQGLSELDFGSVLDKNEALCEEVAALVLSITTTGESIEDALLSFLLRYCKDFGLKERAFSAIDKASIRERFLGCYYTINKASHFDEFIFLDTDKKAPFVSHQGSICLNFAEFIQAAIPKESPEYFKSICDEFNALDKDTLTNTNKFVHARIELSVDELLEKIKDEDHLQAVLDKLPDEQRKEILASPSIKRLQTPKFLHHVARGEQDQAEKLLNDYPDKAFLLQQSEPFTDYSGRTFNCTAFEYAYWAKDTYMCRMLMKHMDDETKTEMLKRCEAMEEQGLAYLQHGEVINSKHFNLGPLIKALQNYADGNSAWIKNENYTAVEAACMEVGKAQRDVPAHVAHEYCSPYRSFDRLFTFRFYEDTLLRRLVFYNVVTEREELWFPLLESTSSGIGVDFAVFRGDSVRPAGGGWLDVALWRNNSCVAADLAAVSLLDEVRNTDLTRLREGLKVAVQDQSHGMSC